MPPLTPGTPVPPPADAASTHEVVATFTDYVRAQAAVDLLADKEFDVRDVRIVGHDMKSVEVVTGRMTNLRATLMGVASGAWFGLMVGLLIGLFAKDGNWFRIVSSGVVIGAAFGSLYGLLGHLATRGARDFASTQALTASTYEVLVPAERAGEARRLIQAGR